MYKLIAVTVMSLFVAIALNAGEVKETACKAACATSKEKCMKEAGGSMMKEMACNKADEKCQKDCEKKK